jgi:hypothetical protein
VASTRSEFPEDILGIDQSPGSNIGIGVAERLMEGGTVGVIQPVAGVERQEFHFSAVGQIRRFVNNEPSGFDRSFDGHEGSVPLDRPPNKALHPTPPASLAAAGGAGERRRWADQGVIGNVLNREEEQET